MTTTMNASKLAKTSIVTSLAFAILFLFSAVSVHAQPSAPGDDPTLEQFDHASPRTLASVSQEQWRDYSERLSQTLMAEHAGLQQSALQRIIRYGSYLTSDKETVFEIVKIYRGNDDERMRRMAVVALGELEDPWAMGFLKRAVRFEKSAEVAHTIKYVLKNYNGSYQ